MSLAIDPVTGARIRAYGIVLEVDVPGTPAPKGSARAFVNKTTGRAFVAPGGARSTERKITAWSAAVRARVLESIGAVEAPVLVRRPVSVEIVFRLARPSGHWGARGLKASAPNAPATKPDIDKLARTTLDALTGLVFDDDSRVVILVATKVYAEPGREGAWIRVKESA